MEGGADPVLHVLLQAHRLHFLDMRRLFLRLSFNGGQQQDFYAQQITGLSDTYMVKTSMPCGMKNVALIQMGKSSIASVHMAPNNHIVDMDRDTLLYVTWGDEIRKQVLEPGKQLLFIVQASGTGHVSVRGSMKQLGRWKHAPGHDRLDIPKTGSLLAIPVECREETIQFKLVRHQMQQEASGMEWEPPVHGKKTVKLSATPDTQVLVTRWNEPSVYITDVGMSTCRTVEKTDPNMLDILNGAAEMYKSMNSCTAACNDIIKSNYDEEAKKVAELTDHGSMEVTVSDKTMAAVATKKSVTFAKSQDSVEFFVKSEPMDVSITDESLEAASKESVTTARSVDSVEAVTNEPMDVSITNDPLEVDTTEEPAEVACSKEPTEDVNVSKPLVATIPIDVNVDEPMETNESLDDEASMQSLTHKTSDKPVGTVSTCNPVVTMDTDELMDTTSENWSTVDINYDEAMEVVFSDEPFVPAVVKKASVSDDVMKAVRFSEPIVGEVTEAQKLADDSIDGAPSMKPVKLANSDEPMETEFTEAVALNVVAKDSIEANFAKDPKAAAVFDGPLEAAAQVKPQVTDVSDKSLETAATDEPMAAAFIDVPMEGAVTKRPMQNAVIDEPLEAAGKEDTLMGDATNEQLEALTTIELIEAAIMDEPNEPAVFDDPVEDATVKDSMKVASMDEQMEVLASIELIEAAIMDETIEPVVFDDLGENAGMKDSVGIASIAGNTETSTIELIDAALIEESMEEVAVSDGPVAEVKTDSSVAAVLDEQNEDIANVELLETVVIDDSVKAVVKDNPMKVIPVDKPGKVTVTDKSLPDDAQKVGVPFEPVISEIHTDHFPVEVIESNFLMDSSAISFDQLQSLLAEVFDKSVSTVCSEESMAAEGSEEPIPPEVRENPINVELSEEPMASDITADTMRAEHSDNLLPGIISSESIPEISDNAIPVSVKPKQAGVSEALDPGVCSEDQMQADDNEELICAELNDKPISVVFSEEPIQDQLSKEIMPLEVSDEPISAVFSEKPMQDEVNDEPIPAVLIEARKPTEGAMEPVPILVHDEAGQTLVSEEFHPVAEQVSEDSVSGAVSSEIDEDTKAASSDQMVQCAAGVDAMSEIAERETQSRKGVECGSADGAINVLFSNDNTLLSTFQEDAEVCPREATETIPDAPQAETTSFQAHIQSVFRDPCSSHFCVTQSRMSDTSLRNLTTESEYQSDVQDLSQSSMTNLAVLDEAEDTVESCTAMKAKSDAKAAHEREKFKQLCEIFLPTETVKKPSRLKRARKFLGRMFFGCCRNTNNVQG